MRRQMPNERSSGARRNILSNTAYSIFQSSETVRSDPFDPRNHKTTNRRVNFVHESNNGSGYHQAREQSGFLQRSVSADNVVVRQRGFKPSDRHDPAKRNILEGLTRKILHFDMENDSRKSSPINLKKLLTPASDSSEITTTMKNKKMYASSYFYAPTHPTVEDQVELARRISNSLSDVKNVKSKGQSMYVNRKKRSVKWIHDGNGIEEAEEESSSTVRKDKVPLKCMMNPNGKVLDIHGIQEVFGEEVNMQEMPEHPERLFDIVRDLNNQKGRGAEIFAKRRKRSEKWVVDPEQSQPSNPYSYGKTPIYPIKSDTSIIDNAKFDSKPYYNPFTHDISMDYTTPSITTNKLYDNAYHGPKISSYQNLANYNTAPRGWSQSQQVYRPVKFENKQDIKISYSDF